MSHPDRRYIPERDAPRVSAHTAALMRLKAAYPAQFAQFYAEERETRGVPVRDRGRPPKASESR